MTPETGPAPAPITVVGRILKDGKDAKIQADETVDHALEQQEYARLRSDQKLAVHKHLAELRTKTEVQSKLDALKAQLPVSTLDHVVGTATETGRNVVTLLNEAQDSSKPEEQKAAMGKLAMIAAPLAIGVVAAISWLSNKGKAAGAGILTALGLGGTGLAAFFLGKGSVDTKAQREASERASKAVEGKKDADGALEMKDLPAALSLFGRKLKLPGDNRPFTLERGTSGLSVATPAGNFDAYLKLGGTEKGIENIGDIVPGPDGGIAVRIEKSQSGFKGSALAQLEKDQVRKLLDASTAGGADPKSVDVTFKIHHRDFGGYANAERIREAVSEMTGGAVMLDTSQDPMVWDAKVVLKSGMAVKRETIGPSRTTTPSLEQARGMVNWREADRAETALETKRGTVDLGATPPRRPLLLDRNKSARQSFALTPAAGGAARTFDLRMQRGDVVPGAIFALPPRFETAKTELLLDDAAATFRLQATERGLTDARGQAFGTLVDRVERTAGGVMLVTKHTFAIGTPPKEKEIEGKTLLTAAQLERLLNPPRKLEDVNVTINITDFFWSSDRAALRAVFEERKLAEGPPDTFSIPLQLALEKLEGVTPPPA